jgi:hypothetical protein
MPESSTKKVRKKRLKAELISEQQALDFAQLILDIYNDKKNKEG